MYGWGKNVFGQLGVNDEQNRSCPTHLRTLRCLGVRYISCGDDFSVFLTADGGVFTCGSGTYGQLGHGSTGNDYLPRMIVELMGTACTQIACGGRHTVAFVSSRGRVYAFGLGGSGQLGNRSNANVTSPQVVIGPWVSADRRCAVFAKSLELLCVQLSPSGQSLVGEKANMIVRKIFSGGDQSFVSAVGFDQRLEPVDCRIWK